VTARLSQPLPLRYHEHRGATWASIPWTRAAALSAFTAGGWFDWSQSGLYSFAPEAEGWIRSAQRSFYLLKEEVAL
jgi:hypothetical protein